MGSEAPTTQGSWWEDKKRNELLQQRLPPQDSARPQEQRGEMLQKAIHPQVSDQHHSPAQLRMKWLTTVQALNTSGEADCNSCPFQMTAIPARPEMPKGCHLSPCSHLSLWHAQAAVEWSPHTGRSSTLLAKLPVNGAEIASKLTKGHATPNTGKLANLRVLQRSLKKLQS